MIIIRNLARFQPILRNLSIQPRVLSIYQPIIAKNATSYLVPLRALSSKDAPPPYNNNQDNNKFEYKVRFKQDEIKGMFKEFYKLYGPLFVVCHLSVSLVSLGFFCSLVWFSIDPVAYMPDWLKEQVGQRMISMTGDGGKFLVAYAIHKLILPIRLGGAITLTRFLAKKWKARMK